MKKFSYNSLRIHGNIKGFPYSPDFGQLVDDLLSGRKDIGLKFLVDEPAEGGVIFPSVVFTAF
jgi:hypothetical protein